MLYMAPLMHALERVGLCSTVSLKTLINPLGLYGLLSLLLYGCILQLLETHELAYWSIFFLKSLVCSCGGKTMERNSEPMQSPIQLSVNQF